MRAAERELRLLPWTGEDGKPCYLATGAARDGTLSRLADAYEERQLQDAAYLLAAARVALRRPLPRRQANDLAARLADALRDTLRVAECRARSRPPEDDG